jgi:hypothetical protein
LSTISTDWVPGVNARITFNGSRSPRPPPD